MLGYHSHLCLFDRFVVPNLTTITYRDLNKSAF